MTVKAKSLSLVSVPNNGRSIYADAVAQNNEESLRLVPFQQDGRSDEESEERGIETPSDRNKGEGYEEGNDASCVDTPSVRFTKVEVDPYLEAEKRYQNALVAQLNADLKLHFLARDGADEDKSKRGALKECIALFIGCRNEALKLKTELTEVNAAQIVEEKKAQAREDFRFLLGDEASAATYTTSKKAWTYFKKICTIVINRMTYKQSFSAIENDPLYAYLMSCTYNDEPDKQISQQISSQDGNQFCDAMEIIGKAKESLPKFVEMCKDIARKLGVRQVGVGEYGSTVLFITRHTTYRRSYVCI